jgi:predicted ArsR family transcriptional regulator
MMARPTQIRVFTARPAQRRVFNGEEEQLMLQQSHGDYSLHQLHQKIGGSREAIIQHMKELGLRPVIVRKAVKKETARSHSKAQEPRDSDERDAAPTVGKDKLLQALVTHHKERLFE